MKYVLRWKQSALDDLARIWLESDSTMRKAITQSSHRLDSLLQHDPLGQGESREANERIMFLEPLGIRYSMYPETDKVVVIRVWKT